MENTNCSTGLKVEIYPRSENLYTKTLFLSDSKGSHTGVPRYALLFPTLHFGEARDTITSKDNMGEHDVENFIEEETTSSFLTLSYVLVDFEDERFSNLLPEGVNLRDKSISSKISEEVMSDLWVEALSNNEMQPLEIGSEFKSLVIYGNEIFKSSKVDEVSSTINLAISNRLIASYSRSLGVEITLNTSNISVLRAVLLKS